MVTLLGRCLVRFLADAWWGRWREASKFRRLLAGDLRASLSVLLSEVPLIAFVHDKRELVFEWHDTFCLFK